MLACMAISSTLSASERKSCAKKIRIPPPRPRGRILPSHQRKKTVMTVPKLRTVPSPTHAQWRLSLPYSRNAGNACMHEGMMKGILLDVLQVQRMNRARSLEK